MAHPAGSLYRLTAQQARFVRAAMIEELKKGNRRMTCVGILRSLDEPVQPAATPKAKT